MIKKTFLLMFVSGIFLWLCVLKPANAAFAALTPEQIEEAIEYGQKNKNLEIAVFSKPWTVFLGKGIGSATLFTSYHNIAYKARKHAIERREFTAQNMLDAIGMGDAISFTATVYGEAYDFAMRYTAKLYQKEEVIQPDFEFVPEIADASEFWPNSPCHTARLVFKFLVKEINMEAPVTLAIVAPGGIETLFDFDLSKMK